MQDRNDADQERHHTIDPRLFRFSHEETEHSLVEGFEGRVVEADDVSADNNSQERCHVANDGLFGNVSEIRPEYPESCLGWTGG